MVDQSREYRKAKLKYHKRRLNITKPNARTAKTIVKEYPFWRIVIGSSTGTITPVSRVPLIENIPADETIRSNEWTTRGNKMKPDGSETKEKTSY